MFDKLFEYKLKMLKRKGDRYRKEKELIDSYSDCWPGYKKRKVSNIMLAVSVTVILAYTIVCLFIQYFTGFEVSSTLTTCLYAFFGSELFLLAGIRTSKVIKGYDSTEAQG